MICDDRPKKVQAIVETVMVLFEMFVFDFTDHICTLQPDQLALILITCSSPRRMRAD